MLHPLVASLSTRRATSWKTRPSTSRRARLGLEELESRALLSASGWTATPNFTVTPLAATTARYVYTPQQIQTAYGFNNVYSGAATGTALDGTGETIAIVDAYDDPTIAQDVAKFDAQWNLPTAVLNKVAPNMPAGTFPKADAGWSTEIALDVEWAHVVAPGATILLVEANSASSTDLLNAVKYANSQGVAAVSMSWGGSEFSGEKSYDSTYFASPGTVYVASAGDSGARAGAEWPSVSPNVLAVGGTSLYLNGSSYSSETTWSSGGGGYSVYEATPTYQKPYQSASTRSAPDVSYVADPNTGVYVYSAGSWYSVGGTSAGAPQWAGLVALADEGRGSGHALSNIGSAIYSLSASDFHDITSGSNGYSALSGYDLATGRGSPHADNVVRDLITPPATAYKPATALQPQRLASSNFFFFAFGFRADGSELGDPASTNAALATVLSSRPALNMSAPTPQTPLSTSDKVWLVEGQQLPTVDGFRYENALRDVARAMQRGVPSSFDLNDDADLSAGSADYAGGE